MTPNSSAIFTAVRGFLLQALPDLGSENVIAGQVNRVAEPKAADFAVFWPLSLGRLATNRDTFEDVYFVGTITGTILTVVVPQEGMPRIGDTVYGVGVAPGTKIIGPGTGVISESSAPNLNPPNTFLLNAFGSTIFATFEVNVLQTVALRTLATGREGIAQNTDVVCQLDIHGPNSFDNAQIVNMLMRDDRGVDMFADTGVVPLYSNDPIQLPFLDGEQQYEDRFVVELHLEADITITLPQQFAASVRIALINAGYNQEVLQ